MSTLAGLKNQSRTEKSNKRVGRGIGSGLGKTSGRGQKGAGARSGHKQRHGYEGGQFRTYMKLPQRGFSNVRFRRELDTINLGQIEKVFEDGETVNIESLKKHGFISGQTYGLKILGQGELIKKVTIEANAVSKGARDKLQKAKIVFSLVGEEKAEA